MSLEFPGLDAYHVTPHDVYGKNWRVKLRALLSENLNLWPSAFAPPIKGQLYAIETLDGGFTALMAGITFSCDSPRIILNERQSLNSFLSQSTNPPDQVQCYCPACIASRSFKQPRIGSIVHYTDCHDVVVPAIVLRLYTKANGANDNTVYLQLFREYEQYCAARYGHTSGTWHWPSDS